MGWCHGEEMILQLSSQECRLSLTSSLVLLAFQRVKITPEQGGDISHVSSLVITVDSRNPQEVRSQQSPIGAETGNVRL